MDTIIKWSTGIVICAIAAHFAISGFLSPKLAEIAAGGTGTERSASLSATAGESVLSAQADGKVDAATEEIEDPLPGRAVRLKAGQNGHFYLDAKVNGATTPFLVDTGASMIALSYEAAEKAGVRLRKSDFKYSASTANGTVPMAIVTLDSIRYKNIYVRDVRAGVLPKGALSGANLLGNSFLEKLREYKVSDGTLVMIP